MEQNLQIEVGIYSRQPQLRSLKDKAPDLGESSAALPQVSKASERNLLTTDTKIASLQEHTQNLQAKVSKNYKISLKKLRSFRNGWNCLD